MPQHHFFYSWLNTAIRYALDRYERGEVRVNAVKDMISRLSHELEGLRTIVASHEKKLSEMGIAVEPCAEQLDQQFGGMVSEEKKQSVLLSDDASRVLPRGVRGSHGSSTGFEIAEMSLEDPAKLRALLVKDCGSPRLASAKDRVRRRHAVFRAEPSTPSPEK